MIYTGSSNLIYEFDENGNRVFPPNPLAEYGITFIDRDGSEHSWPTAAHKGARVPPARKWDELTDAEKETERQRLGGSWPIGEPSK